MGILDRTEALSDRPDTVSLSESFLENTKFRPWGTSELARTPGDYQDVEIDAMTKAYKRYRLRRVTALPAPEELSLPPATFAETVGSRRTVRSFSEQPVALSDLSALLHLSGGITGQQGKQLLRATPSAGALYPVEIYLHVRDVAGLDPGIYHYFAPDHALARLGDTAPEDEVSRVCCWQPQAAQSPVVIFLAGMVQRTVRKYGDRGLRYVFLDAGHLAQNLCLAATATGLACMTTCGFYDDEANDLFGLDGVAESMLYVAFVGHPSAAGGDPTKADGPRQD